MKESGERETDRGAKSIPPRVNRSKSGEIDELLEGPQPLEHGRNQL